MNGQVIGKDRYGRTMRLYHSGDTVYCDHIKEGVYTQHRTLKVDHYIIMMFHTSGISGAYIYDEIKRRYGVTL